MCAKRAKNNDIYKLIAYNIKKYRIEAKITQEKLAELSGYSHEYIRRIEAPGCDNSFSLNTISIIANALDLDMRELLNPIEEEDSEIKK